jgi:hypothetical protein
MDVYKISECNGDSPIMAASEGGFVTLSALEAKSAISMQSYWAILGNMALLFAL